MITTVTMNPAIDKSIILNKVSFGEVNTAAEALENAGGKGINVSKVLNVLGVDSIATGILGQDNADFFINYLSSRNIKNDFQLVKGKTRTNIKLIEISKNRTTDINEAGIEVKAEDLLKIKSKIVELAKRSEYVVLSGSLPIGVPDDFYADIINTIKDYTITVLDTSGARLTGGIEAGAHIIKPNKYEMEQSYGISFGSNDECVDFCKKLICKSQLKTILLTLAADGAVFIQNDKILYSEPVKVKVINTVGAGDSFLGGYLAGKSDGLTGEEAFRMAAACGTLAAMQKGTDVFSLDDYNEMIKKVHIRL